MNFFDNGEICAFQINGEYVCFECLDPNRETLGAGEAILSKNLLGREGRCFCTRCSRFIERRKQDRFEVREGAFVSVKGEHYIIGPIHDISRGGVGFMYVGKEDKVQGSPEVDIFFSGGGLYLQNVKAEIISNFRIDKKVPNSSPAIRQCGMRFSALTVEQADRLDDFIREYLEWRFGVERRKHRSNGYEGPERRKGGDRRKILATSPYRQSYRSSYRR